MALDTRSKIGLATGLTLTAIVVGLLIYGNFFAKSSNPTFWTWEQQPTLLVCDTAPAWARPGQASFDTALAFWAKHGWGFKSVEVGTCATLCDGYDEDHKELAKVTCNPGKVTLDLFAGTWWKEDHVGVCVTPKLGDLGPADWSTIMVPSVIPTYDETKPLDEPVAWLPKDAEAVVVAHEMGHCLVGVGHNIGPQVLPHIFLNPKTGHLMNPVILKGGWGDESLPKPSKW